MWANKVLRAVDASHWQGSSVPHIVALVGYVKRSSVVPYFLCMILNLNAQPHHGQISTNPKAPISSSVAGPLRPKTLDTPRLRIRRRVGDQGRASPEATGTAGMMRLAPSASVSGCTPRGIDPVSLALSTVACANGRDSAHNRAEVISSSVCR
jgi:hypothetical protein